MTLLRDMLPKTERRPCAMCTETPLAFPFIRPEDVLCPRCADAEGDVIAKERAKRTTNEQQDERAFRGKLRRSGLESQTRIVDDLGITRDGDVALAVPQQGARWRDAAEAVLRYLGAARSGTLALSGPSGTGKSTCAAYAAWRTGGLYLPRERWSGIPPWDSELIIWYGQHGGVLVLDEVCLISGRGEAADRDAQRDIIGSIVKARHAREAATIITTNATEEEFLSTYGTLGEALWRRAQTDLAGNPAGGGWVECKRRTR